MYKIKIESQNPKVCRKRLSVSLLIKIMRPQYYLNVYSKNKKKIKKNGTINLTWRKESLHSIEMLGEHAHDTSNTRRVGRCLKVGRPFSYDPLRAVALIKYLEGMTIKLLSINCGSGWGGGYSPFQRKTNIYIYYWNKVTVHHLKLCYFLMKKDNTMICGVLLNHCLTVNRIISKSVCLDTRLRDTSLKRCGAKSQFTNSVSCVSIIGVDASLTTTTHASTTTTHASSL